MADNLYHSCWAISPLDGRYAVELEGLASLVSEGGLMVYRMEVEIRWLLFLHQLAATGELALSWRLTSGEEEFLRAFLCHDNHEAMVQRIKALEQRCNHDVKAVEYFLAEQLAANGAQDATRALVHFACTSEDINNLAYARMLAQVTKTHVLPTMAEVINQLAELARTNAQHAMVGRTHGQTASPTTLGKEFAVFGHRLQRVYQRLERQEFRGKFNGAVGNFNAHLVAFPSADWLGISQRFVEDHLQLTWNKWTTQIEDHDYIAEYADTVRLYNTIATGLSQDCWQYISQGYLRQKHRKNEVGSSTMPHKINPIAFENAEGQFGLSSALAQYFSHKLPISRLQRDLSDSTVLRSLGTMLGHHLLAERALLRGLGSMSADPGAMGADLNEAWEVLGEAVQTLLRREGHQDAYELLKECTRGKAVDRELLLGIAGLPAEVRTVLAGLSPEKYLGLAEKLALDFATQLSR